MNPFGFFKVRIEITTRHSGVIVCVQKEITIRDHGNELVGIDWLGTERGRPQYIRLDDVVAIHWRNVGFWGLF